ncbi:Unknown protein [Striga hermonthica]|uniref:No apical meristem-associated C-terminal domain-containing protein n=1 Tax=Striga hermonthica TaxID=68872 RepID=A0A9N7R777_STRHE|nr:Unknown protein [Striga hermonthica]
MSRRTYRQMAPPPDEDGSALTTAPAYQFGSAPAPTLHASARIPATGPNLGGQPGIPDVGEKERPIGTNQAKKQRNSKGRVKNDDDVNLDDDLKKFIDIEAATKKRQEDFLEAHERITHKKFETARLRRESVLLESYQKLLCMDTREMTEDVRAEHVLAMKMLREKLASNNN